MIKCDNKQIDKYRLDKGKECYEKSNLLVRVMHGVGVSWMWAISGK